jgi:predicted nuclease with TOPRIM domain
MTKILSISVPEDLDTWMNEHMSFSPSKFFQDCLKNMIQEQNFLLKDNSELRQRVERLALRLSQVVQEKNVLEQQQQLKQ